MRTAKAGEQRVLAPPPAIYFSGLVLGVVFDALFPISLHGSVASLGLFGPQAPMAPRLIIGLSVLAAGFALNLSAVQRFRQAETTVLPWGRPTAFVTAGPYRFSRNPMYLGLSIGYVGLAITVGSLWAFLLLPAVLVAMVYGVIRREEAHLARRFGAQYEAYRARVRRWL